MKFVISLTIAHDMLLVTADQLQNIWKWVPEAIVVMHVHPTIKTYFRETPQLYVNPIRYKSTADTILKLHVLNYQYIREKVSDLDYFAIEA